ncbi:MAG: hypothetical protein N2Z69_07320 [Methylophilaceae bacterium]|nr:hypothetical protein [Methylophilaceae bacterium]
MMNSVFLEPLDVLFLRGNKLFGDAGSFGESLVPPWPSVAAGALRSRLLADDKFDLAAFARGEVTHPVLGTPERPGPFTITAFHLARRRGDGRIEILVAPPADLVITQNQEGGITVRSLKPTEFSQTGAKIQSSAFLPQLPVLAETQRSKPIGGCWLGEAGWAKYLYGETPTAEDFVQSSALWSLDLRIGVGLDTARRRAADHRLFSTQAIAMQPGVGFLAAVQGATLPTNGSVRLGGDGRAAAIHPVTTMPPAPNYEAIAAAGRCKLVLTTPGIFEQGWLPIGAKCQNDGTCCFELMGIRARIVSAAVPRAVVTSGWDVAKWQPKPAEHSAPTGSVYWLDELDATPDALRKLAEHGLWSESCENPIRRAEGFNRIAIAAY